MSNVSDYLLYRRSLGPLPKLDGKSGLAKMKNHKTTPTLSVVIPLFNEQDNMSLLVERVSISLNNIDVTSEIILVDDGSVDKTWTKIQSACDQYPNIKAIRFSRNFGHLHVSLSVER